MFCTCCGGDNEADKTPETVTIKPLVDSRSDPCGDPDEREAAAEAMKDVREGVTLHFQLPDGSIQRVVFTKKPLGIDFIKNTPLTVKKIAPGSEAEEAQVQKSWIVTHVDGNPISSQLPDAVSQLMDATKTLPPRQA
mmetsp:Transcript_30630/g.57308  ORF Transcript_30630/g.57308 Transcript_30630/m.57308 type:complete len:137 (+) Transcript_30630:108-518(+)